MVSDHDDLDRDRRALLAASAALAGGGIATVPAAAQDTDEPTSTPTPNATAGNETTATPNGTDWPSRAEQAQTAAEQAEQAVETEEGPTYLARISDSLRVRDYGVAPSQQLEDEDVDKSRVDVHLEADGPAAITKTDAFGAFESRGVNTINEETEAIPAGKSKVSMRCTVVRGVVGMGISTDRGGVGVSSGVPSGSGTKVGLTHGIATGIGTAVIGTVAAAWRHARDDLQEPEEWGDDDSGGLL